MRTTPTNLATLPLAEKRELLAQFLRQQSSASITSYPLSYGQQALWFQYRMAPHSAAYNVNVTARIRSDVDVPALRSAFQALLDRHPALRTTFAVADGKPIQQIHQRLEVCFRAEDASAWSWEALHNRLVEEAHRPFNLQQGPIVRVHLLRRSAQEHFLALTVHHIVIDFWSLMILLDDLRRLYPAARTGLQASLPRLDLHYTDYVSWQTEMLTGAPGKRLSAYWQKQLEGELPILHLPSDRARPPVQTYRGASHTFGLEAELTQGLKALAQAEGATLYMVLLAAFQVLLHRYTGQEDLLVGSPMASRSRAGFAGIVGYCVNTVVMRAHLSRDPSFKTFLEQTRHTVLEALEHQDYPFPVLVEQLQPQRDASRSPLVQVMFVLQSLHRAEVQDTASLTPRPARTPTEAGGLVLEPYTLEQRSSQFDLTLLVGEGRTVLEMTLQYNTDLFDATTMTRMAGHFYTLLQSIVAGPQRPISTLPLLTAAERHCVIEVWNDPDPAPPPQVCVQQLFEAQAEQVPDAVAVICTDEQLTYRALNQRANQLAHYLRRLGVGPETLVGLCVERSLEMVVGLLAVLKIGAAYVPLDAAYPRERLKDMLDDARVTVVLTQERLMARLPASRVVCLDAEWPSIARQSAANPDSEVRAENLAYVIYTSGSTGRPKGIGMPHRSLANLLVWQQENSIASRGTKTLQFASLSFDVSFQELFSTWCSGGTLVLIPEAMRQDIERLACYITDAAIARLFLPVVVLQRLAEAYGTLCQAPPRLREVITAGEQLHITPSIAQMFAPLADCTLHNQYGPSESHVVSTFTLSASSRLWPTLPPIGRPIANTQLYLLDAAHSPVPVGLPGTLYIGGTALARGYINRPGLTAEKFIPNPFSTAPGARLYTTGDLSRYRPDGTIEFLGRSDHQVKVRGYRIELGEIEAVLRQHPALREVLVVDREKTPGDKQLVAYVVPAQRPGPTHSACRDFLRQKLPDYMIPAAFVVLDALPLTANGKVDHRSLPTPDEARPHLEQVFVTPCMPVEKELATIWSEVLGIESIGRYDNFFELGGHSLLAVQLMSRLQHTFGRELPLSTLLQAPTIAHLALHVQETPALASASLVPMQTHGARPPLFCLHAAGGQVMAYQPLAALLGPDQPLYGLQSRALVSTIQEYDRLDDMAAAYAASIRQQQPTGPYYLLGWSLGGILAMTVAKVLEQQGQGVAFVGLLDTRLPKNDDLSWGHDPLLGLLVAFGGTMAAALAALAPVEQQALREELVALPPMERLQRLTAWGRERRLLTSDVPLATLQRQAALAEVHVALWQTQKTTPMQAPLFVWWARQSLREGKPPTDWKRYALGNMSTDIVEGNHFSIMQSPHVHLLAARLRACLRTAQEEMVPVASKRLPNIHRGGEC